MTAPCSHQWLVDLVEGSHDALLTDPAASQARDILDLRGVPSHLWSTYRIGYSSPTRQVTRCAKAFQTWFPRYYYRRLVFPLYSPLGHLIGIQTRSLEDKSYQQYFAEPSGLYPFMFGFPHALDAIYTRRSAVLVEGVFDFFAVVSETPTVLATLSANVPRSTRRFLDRYCRQVTALLDMDAPGRRGVESLRRSLTCTVSAPTYSLHDPSDLLKAGRIPELRRILSRDRLDGDPARGTRVGTDDGCREFHHPVSGP